MPLDRVAPLTRLTRLTRRRHLRALAGMGGLTLAACDAFVSPLGPRAAVMPAPTTPTASGRVTVTQWFNLAGAPGAHAAATGARFGQFQERIEVRTAIVPQPELATTLATALAAGDPPDVVHAHSASLNALLIDGGHTAPLDQWDPRIATYDWLPAVKEALSRDGRLMACPATTGVLGFIYNKDLYERSGLDPERPPGSLYDLAAGGAKIADAERGVWGHYVGLGPATWTADTIFVAYLWAFGGDVVSADGTQVVFHQAAGQAALQYYVDLAQQQVFPLKVIDAPVMGEDFEAGTVGSVTLSPVWVGRLEQTRHRTGTAPFPSAPGRKVPAGLGAASILRQAKQSDAAWSYVAWLLRPENHLAWVTGFGGLPARLSYRNHSVWQQYEAEHPLVRPYVASQLQAHPAYFGPGALQVWTSLAQAIDGAVRQRQPVTQALDDAASQAQEDLNQARLSRTLLDWFR